MRWIHSDAQRDELVAAKGEGPPHSLECFLNAPLRQPETRCMTSQHSPPVGAAGGEPKVYRRLHSLLSLAHILDP